MCQMQTRRVVENHAKAKPVPRTRTRTRIRSQKPGLLWHQEMSRAKLTEHENKTQSRGIFLDSVSVSLPARISISWGVGG